MERRYRVYVAWRGRDDDLRDMSRQLASFVSALGAACPRAKGLRFVNAADKEVAVSGIEGCQSALEAHRVDWATGETRRVAYQPCLFLERRAAPPVEVNLTCGIERLHLGPIYTPNRLELWVRRDAGDDLVSRSALEGMLRAAVEAFRPDFGFVGADGIPEPPLAVFSDGVPVVGWMTFLSWRYPPLPGVLPEPAVAYVIPRRGTLVVAHPELWSSSDAGQVAAVERVREALSAAGVLVPAVMLDETAGPVSQR